jgi:hypothetical protein
MDCDLGVGPLSLLMWEQRMALELPLESAFCLDNTSLVVDLWKFLVRLGSSEPGSEPSPSDIEFSLLKLKRLLKDCSYRSCFVSSGGVDLLVRIYEVHGMACRPISIISAIRSLMRKPLGADGVEPLIGVLPILMAHILGEGAPIPLLRRALKAANYFVNQAPALITEYELVGRAMSILTEASEKDFLSIFSIIHDFFCPVMDSFLRVLLNSPQSSTICDRIGAVLPSGACFDVLWSSAVFVCQAMANGYPLSRQETGDPFLASLLVIWEYGMDADEEIMLVVLKGVQNYANDEGCRREEFSEIVEETLIEFSRLDENSPERRDKAVELLELLTDTLLI